ncbi:lethal giant larvae like, C-terminal-domain-containing protein [Protomyces lactucae-debilis]|uniref:Lethal giant larvae like, C-terminal-domain-containing protein n=1 Tax=Protomyces lactucae-debilis TaxID=2754530 RepID=A0A1Y2FS33_PROLT|nr:lethal giant larvae like, C-terminal-domain-containing protein [Protomyces lactucae-debilis]ORY86798.1 lethal giant larvae like, C-terminal-domain-containing protein [Protomyces lactucae-debilis]
MSKRLFGKQKAFEDLSGGFQRGLLQKDDLARYGIAGKILHVAYDQVQSLVAVATTHGAIHVLGQNGVEVVYVLPAGCTAHHLCLHRSHLTAIDQRNTLHTWLLEDCRDSRPAAVYALRGVVTAIHVEPSVDWLFLGMTDGSICVWDLEGEQMTTYKVKNLYFERQEEARMMEYDWAVPRYHISPVLSLQIHPLDLGMLLVGYPDGAALYSFKDGSCKAFFETTIAADGHKAQQRPHLTCATFSPDGNFVATGHQDGSFAFFNVQDSEIPLQIRSLSETDLNLTRRDYTAPEGAALDPVFDISWCCRAEAGDSFLLVAGGTLQEMRGLGLLDLGPLPSRTADYSSYFATPRRQKILPLESRQLVRTILPLGTASPFYAASHDSQAALLLLADGTCTVLSLPSGAPVSSSVLPPPLAFACPPCSLFTISEMPRALHAGMYDNARKRRLLERNLLIGGAPAKRRLRSFEQRLVLLSVHGQQIRLSDISHAEMAEAPLLSVDVEATLPQGGRISQVSLAGTAGELALATATGGVLILKYPIHANSGIESHPGDVSQVTPLPSPLPDAQNLLFGFEPSQAAAFNPVCLLQANQGSVTTVKMSDVGFAAIGYETGMLCLVDMRGPAIIFMDTCERLQIRAEKGFFKRKSVFERPLPGSQPEYATCCEFLTMGIEGRLAITLVVGTSKGRTLILELLKDAQGMFSAVLNHAETGQPQEGAVTSILGCLATGDDLAARPEHLAMLQEDSGLPECLLIVTEKGVRSVTGNFKSTLGKADCRQSPARSAALITIPGSINLVLLAVASGSNAVELFSVPALRPLGHLITPEHASASMVPFISTHGDVVCQSSLEGGELALINMLGTGVTLRDVPPDALFDALKQPAMARPTISNWQWLSGTQHIKPSDLDTILSDGVRPLSKRAQERIRASEKQRQLVERQEQISQQQNERVRGAQRGALGRSREGRDTYGEMQQQGQERGERMSQLDETFENLSKASGDFLTEVDKFASNAKKQVMLGGARKMFGL